MHPMLVPVVATPVVGVEQASHSPVHLHVPVPPQAGANAAVTVPVPVPTAPTHRAAAAAAIAVPALTGTLPHGPSVHNSGPSLHAGALQVPPPPKLGLEWDDALQPPQAKRARAAEEAALAYVHHITHKTTHTH